MPRIGSIRCPAPGCGCSDATVSETPGGTLNISCHRCEFSGYGKKGTKARRLIEAATARDQDESPPAPPPKPPPKKAAGKPPAATPAPTPSPAPKKVGFSLEKI